MTRGGIGDHTAGIVRFGRDNGRSGIGASLFFSHGDRRHVCRPGCHGYAGFGRSLFNRGYYPCYGSRYFPAYSHYPYYGSYSYLPLFWPGFASSYTSVYYDSPAYDVGTVDYGPPLSSSEYAAPQRSAEYLGTGVTNEPLAGNAPVAPSESAAPQINQEQAALLDRGDEAFTAGRFDEASRWYVSAMLADDKDGVAALLYAVSNVALGDYQVAAAALRRALETTPELIENPIDVRRLYSQASQFETHRDDLAAFVDDHREDRDATLLLGYLYFASGDADRARTVFEGVSASDPADELAASLAKSTASIVERGKPNANP